MNVNAVPQRRYGVPSKPVLAKVCSVGVTTGFGAGAGAGAFPPAKVTIALSTSVSGFVVPIKVESSNVRPFETLSELAP